MKRIMFLALFVTMLVAGAQAQVVSIDNNTATIDGSTAQVTVQVTKNKAFSLLTERINGKESTIVKVDQQPVVTILYSGSDYLVQDKDGAQLSVTTRIADVRRAVKDYLVANY